MVIGNGMIARVFNKYQTEESVIIFASGVSNSNEYNQDSFLREFNMVKETLLKVGNKLFVYFSSCSLDDAELKNNAYHKHKIGMEDLIKNSSNNYLIFRLPNVIGSLGNDNTVVNYFIKKIKKSEEFVVWKHASRNIVDIEDVYKIVSYIIDNRKFVNKILNIAYDNNVKILDLIQAIAIMLNTTPKFRVEEKGTDMKIDNGDIKQVMKELAITQHDILNLIIKYKGDK